MKPGQPCGVPLKEACRRLGFSLRTGERLREQGRFPVPALKLPIRRVLFSEVVIDEFLREHPTAAVRPQLRRVS